MPFDYSSAPPPRDVELIPHGSIATVVMQVRAGGAGEDGLLKRSKDGGCEMLDCEFVVTDGEFKRRKFWGYYILAGTTDGHAKAMEISQGTLRQILESARGIKPDDMSPGARERRTADLKDFNGLSFIAKIGIEKGRPRNDGSGENYADKNILAAVITPDKKGWHPVDQLPPSSGGSGPSTPSSTPSTPVARSEWAS
jgi:hypothetical protein